MSSIGTVCCNFLDDFQNKTGENIELFFYFFSESRHDFIKFSPVKQEIKKVWSKYVFVNIITLFLRLLAALISFLI